MSVDERLNGSFLGSTDGWKMRPNSRRATQQCPTVANVVQVVTSDYFESMRVVNVKELKARLSAYLREVDRGETFLVTDRSRVVARLGPPGAGTDAAGAEAQSVLARLTALGCRPPLRGPRPTDYMRPGPGSGLTTAEIDAMLDWEREDRR
jgi:antitoxin (DNA-binding transcriptional repressor) of toxin-antitoxin stability system